MSKVYLIKKHGLYYKPNSHGYTGIRDEAGRYTKEEAERIGLDYVHEDDAPAYSPQCYHDLMEAHIKEKDKYIAELEEVIKRVPIMINASIADNYDQRQFVCGEDAYRIRNMCNEALKGGA